MAEIVMPRLSDTMEEGTILRWLKADGDTIARGEELVELETDKATMTYESDLDGVLEILAPEGTTLAVGTVIANVGTGEGRGDAATAPARAPADAAPPGAAPAAEPVGTGAEPVGAAASEPAVDGARQPAHAERVRASPLARRLARERGVDLHELSGSGPGGRIVRADVERGAGAVQAAAGPPAATVQQAPAPAAERDAGGPGLEDVATAKGETTTVELSRSQQAIARRMAESKATIPDFSVALDVDMEECVRLRSELKRLAEPGAGAARAGAGGERPVAAHEIPTYNDMVVKAAALALREHPHVNSSYRDGRLQLHSRVNVGVAVAAERSLVVPTIFDADEKALGEIARESRALAGRVREGTITPPELGGGTFTVSNLGMLGVRSFAAIINPPQAAILSVGAVERRAAVDEDGAIVPRHLLALTLVCDHRVLYGADGAAFLGRVRELLQAPSALTL